MTKELAIKVLTGDVLGTTEQTHEVVAMAVKALSALPSADVTDTNVGNNDLISRQAAVELCMKYNGVGWVWSQILDEIKEMPSAVVQCKDCKFWRDTDHTCKEHSLVSPMGAEEFCSRGERKDGNGNG